MKSPEKVLEFAERLQAFSDDEIAEAIPIAPPAALRAGLAFATMRMPDDAELLDEWLTNLGNFCLEMRSDPVDEPAAAA